jgi:hypothetical protein
VGSLAAERYIKGRVSSCKEQRVATLIDAFYLVRFPCPSETVRVDRLSWSTIEACLWCIADRVSLVEGAAPHCVTRALVRLRHAPIVAHLILTADEQKEIRSIVRDLLPIILLPLCDGVHHNDICRSLPSGGASGLACSRYRAVHQTLGNLIGRPMLASGSDCIVHEYEPSISDYAVVESPTDSSYRRCRKPSCKRFAAAGISVCRHHQKAEKKRRESRRMRTKTTKGKQLPTLL